VKKEQEQQHTTMLRIAVTNSHCIHDCRQRL
jgi:hypothetical protein